jgi:hypothetical protein
MVIIKDINGSTRSLIAGKVVALTDGVGAAAGRVVNLKLDDGTDIAFWNDNEKNLGSRLKAMNVKVGSFISVLVTFRDETRKKANAINFMYGGIWRFPRDIPTATTTGIVTDVVDNGQEVVVTLNGNEKIHFKNPVGQGYRFADRARKNNVMGTNMEVVVENGEVKNFKVNDNNWEIDNSIYAIIGKVSYIDEGTTPSNNPYVRINQSIYIGKSNGESNFAPAYTYFDNQRSSEMLGTIKECVKPTDNVAVICRKNSSKKDERQFTGFYFVPLK